MEGSPQAYLLRGAGKRQIRTLALRVLGPNRNWAGFRDDPETGPAGGPLRGRHPDLRGPDRRPGPQTARACRFLRSRNR